MDTNQTLSTLSKEEVRTVSIKLAKDIAKRIAIGIVVTVVVTIVANKIVESIEN